MYYVYILYSLQYKKSYVGYSSDVQRRLLEHNVSGTKGFTIPYRPWTLIKTEDYPTKTEAIIRERYLKTGRGREELKQIIATFLLGDNSVGGLTQR